MPESLDVRELVKTGRLTIDVPSAGALIGRGRGRAYEMARDGSLPGVRKLGERYLVSLPELCAFLGVDFYALGSGVNANGNGSHSAGTDGAETE